MTEAEFNQASNILSQLARLNVERDLWASVDADTPVTYIIEKQPMTVPNTATQLLRTRMLQDIDARVSTLNAQFAAL
jgi:hypothetical protein